MFAQMPTLVRDGSVWHVLSMNWVNVWQKWAYTSLIANGKLDAECEENQMSKPSKIDCSDIIATNNNQLLTD